MIGLNVTVAKYALINKKTVRNDIPRNVLLEYEKSMGKDELAASTRLYDGEVLIALHKTDTKAAVDWINFDLVCIVTARVSESKYRSPDPASKFVVV